MMWSRKSAENPNIRALKNVIKFFKNNFSAHHIFTDIMKGKKIVIIQPARARQVVYGFDHIPLWWD